ncbi:hypothetical protein NLA06_12715 [Desulfomicrobium sp. ZS1]|uniref:hypothetical protein n=1 Tax=Desulfomicrobium sp. ZS1 TaxID=2952228 RepID=UPI0020B2448C|nr:hypothetical protein [Desulfomicrobium sp. ZS1]UTF49418.1 hypothetical protein NLA06_12715 [Desulfomicrobium sp. ZS1]
MFVLLLAYWTLLPLNAAMGASYVFDPGWTHLGPSPVDVAALTRFKLGVGDGPLRVEKGQLIYPDGASARLWGVGLTFSAEPSSLFPPRKEDVATFVKGLIRYGINHVRFVGIDNTLGDIALGWRKNGYLQSPHLDRLDYLVSVLRNNGICYSFSINNSGMYIFEDRRGLVDATVEPWRRFHHIRLLDEEFIETQLRWYGDFFTRENQYTGLSYAEDPYNVYVVAVNEDSIFATYNRDFRSMSQSGIALCNRLFFKYLAAKYASLPELRSAWGETMSLDREYAQGSVRVLPPGELRRASDERRRDTLDFLVSIDVEFARRIHARLTEAGYRGLFSATNNWYGFGALLAASKVNTYTDMHGYFDHPVNKVISGRPFLPLLLDRSSLMKDFSFPFVKIRIQSLEGLPVIISEWNHAAWSPYAFEGPIMMAAYASLQGYSGLSAHTWMAYPNGDWMTSVPKTAFALGTNPVFLALSPSLSVAFLNGYIDESSDPIFLPMADDWDAYYKFALDARNERQHGTRDYGFELFLKRKVRTRLLGDTAAVLVPNNGVGGGAQSVVSDTRQIEWRYSPELGGEFIVDAERFKAFFTEQAATVRLNGLGVEVQEAGAVTLVALDGEEIAHSERMLLTAVSAMEMGEDRYSFVRADGGKATLRFLRCKVELSVSHDAQWRCFIVYPDGRTRKLSVEARDDEIGKRVLVLDLKDIDSPWVLFERTRE